LDDTETGQSNLKARVDELIAESREEGLEDAAIAEVLLDAAKALLDRPD